MNTTVRILKWLLKTAVFFVLFAFALNNLHTAHLNFVFGHAWQAPMALVVLVAFGLGLGAGIIGMLPARRPAPPPASATALTPESRHGV